MKRPAFQFYPNDWRGNANLRRCSEAARGAWIDVLCLLHDSDEYGVLRWPLVDIAQAAGLPIKLLQELARKNVLKGADGYAAEYVWAPSHAGVTGESVVLVATDAGPCWYCSRFVRDEFIRKRRGAGTRFGENNQPNPKPPAITERQRLRDAVHAKSNGACHHCGVALTSTWEIDHFIPRAKGGSNLFANLVAACIPCNQDKADTLPDDWLPSPTRRVGVRQGDAFGDGPSASASSSTSKAKATAPSGADLLLGLPDDLVRDFLAVRKTKKAALTETAIKGISREAAKAGLTLESAIRLCCERGWASFRADWNLGDAKPAAAAPRRKEL
jgi:hypothetical protein